MNDCKVSLKLCMFYILGILSVVQELSEATILGEVFGPQWGLWTLTGSQARGYCNVLNALQCLGQSHHGRP